MFQLKSQSKVLSGCLIGSSYEKFIHEINEDRTPNLFALHYKLLEWRVENLILIPHFAFPLSAIEKRQPLNPTAQRKGWIGYYIRLNSIPMDARIYVVSAGVPNSVHDVREQYARIRPLETIKAKQRGWTLDILNAVRSLGKLEFSLTDVYEKESELARIHPENRHVRPKIRQQLQVLRDLKLLEFLGGGRYRLP